MFESREEYEFQKRVANDPRLAAIVNLLERELHDCRLTYEDITRAAVLACQRYVERRGLQIVVRIEQAKPSLLKTGDLVFMSQSFGGVEKGKPVEVLTVHEEDAIVKCISGDCKLEHIIPIRLLLKAR